MQFYFRNLRSLICYYLALLVFMTMPALADENMFKVKVVGSGKPIILIPGMMSSGKVWESVIGHFEDNAELHILSVAGFDGVNPVANPSLHRLKNEILDYIDRKNLSRPVLVGHSMGGLTAMLIASHQPEQVGTIVSIDGLPFIGPVFTGSNGANVEDLRPQAEQMKAYFSSLSPEQLEQQTQMGILRHTTDIAGQNLVIQMASRSDPKTSAALMFDTMTTDIRKQISKISQPLLLIGAFGAMPDNQAKASAQKTYQQQLETAQNARLIVHNESRHFVMLDAPDWLNEQLEKALEM